MDPIRFYRHPDVAENDVAGIDGCIVGCLVPGCGYRLVAIMAFRLPLNGQLDLNYLCEKHEQMMLEAHPALIEIPHGLLPSSPPEVEK